MYEDEYGCPRGFSWSEEKQQCVPDRGEVGDRLVQRYERYFFKEEKDMQKQDCPKGHRW